MIKTYTELVESIADELARNDLADQVPEWIQMAEIALARYIRLADGENTIEGVTVADQDFILPPPDIKEIYQIEVRPENQASRTLEIVSWDKFTDVRRWDVSGIPRAAAMLAKKVFLAPTPTAATPYTMFYYGKPPLLSVENPTNDLLEMGPDVLKYNALLYSAPYLGDDERVMTWNAMVAEARETLKKEYWNFKASGGILRIRQDQVYRDSHWQF